MKKIVKILDKIVRDFKEKDVEIAYNLKDKNLEKFDIFKFFLPPISFGEIISVV